MLIHIQLVMQVQSTPTTIVNTTLDIAETPGKFTEWSKLELELLQYNNMYIVNHHFQINFKLNEHNSSLTFIRSLIEFLLVDYSINRNGSFTKINLKTVQMPHQILKHINLCQLYCHQASMYLHSKAPKSVTTFN